MKKIFYIALFASASLLCGCNKFLDRKPLDASASSTFLSNEAEMDLGLTVFMPHLFGLWQTTSLCHIV
jgi:hypothetical protein